MKQMGVGVCVVSPGTIPVCHRTNTSELDKRIKITELILRCVILCLGILAAVLVGTGSQVKQFLSVDRKAKFTDMKSLVFLVVANVLASVYSLVQGFRCVVSIIRGSVLISKPMAWLIFSADQMIAYVMVAAVAATAQSAVFAKEGQEELQWMRVCNMYEKFCKQVGEGMASALVVGISMVALSCISSFSLFRLYGARDKGPKKMQVASLGI